MTDSLLFIETKCQTKEKKVALLQTAPAINLATYQNMLYFTLIS